MSNNKQSSVEWLFQNMFEISQTLVTGEETQYELMMKVKAQAKAMHKEEITEAFLDGKLDGWQNQWAHPNDYYNETFNTKARNENTNYTGSMCSEPQRV